MIYKEPVRPMGGLFILTHQSLYQPGACDNMSVIHEVFDRLFRDSRCRMTVMRLLALSPSEQAFYSRALVTDMMGRNGLDPYDHRRFHYESWLESVVNAMRILCGLEMMISDNVPLDCECSVCLDRLETQCVRLHCGHWFHLLCIGHWVLLGNRHCPNCRTVIILPIFWNLLTL